jgi:hypothetical protein
LVDRPWSLPTGEHLICFLGGSYGTESLELQTNVTKWAGFAAAAQINSLNSLARALGLIVLGALLWMREPQALRAASATSAA